MVNSARSISLKKGPTVFRSEKMADVVSILNNKFKTHITFKDDTIKKFRVSAGFEANDKIEDVLFAYQRQTTWFTPAMEPMLYLAYKNDNNTLSLKQAAPGSSFFAFTLANYMETFDEFEAVYQLVEE
jgi:hypothetical protein